MNTDLKNIKNFNEYIVEYLNNNNEELAQDWTDNHAEKFVSALTKLSKKKAGKEKKDENAPKKNKSAYIFFCTEMRPVVKKECPDLSPKEITAELAIRWAAQKADGGSELDKYNKMAEQDKERYESDKENYVPSDNEENPKKEKKQKKAPKVKDENAPKKNKSAYIFFCDYIRPIIKSEIPDINNKEIMHEMGKRWKELDDKSKEKYNKMAEKDKERFENEKNGKVSEEEEEVLVEESEPETEPVQEKPKKKVAEKKKTEEKPKKTVVKKTKKKSEDDDE